jgi:dolichol-phosphate mannosyltransferase
MNKKVPSISIVVPVYNDQEVIHELYNRLKPVVVELADNYEIILVDDGSKDNSWLRILELNKLDPHVIALQLARNFGQSNAITAGLDNAQHEYIAIMDSDLQDPPEFIINLVEACLTKDVDMAIAKRVSRKDSFIKRNLSNLFNQFVQHTTSMVVPSGLGVFRVIKKEVYDKIKNIPEITGTSLSLLYWGGFDFVSVDLDREVRFAGRSGYTLKKMLSLASSRIFSYSLWPLRVATTLGVITSILSFFLAGYFFIRYLKHGVSIAGWTSTVVILLFLFGISFLIMGIIGEYLGRIYLETKKRPKYVISKIRK